jgi:hypothetical protein
VTEVLPHLFTATDSLKAPSAEVFAVVGEQAIAAFAEARAGTAGNFIAGVARAGNLRDPDSIPARELRDSRLFHRPPMKPAAESGVMHHFVVTNVNAMMVVAETWSDQMRAKGEYPFQTPLRVDGRWRDARDETFAAMLAMPACSNRSHRPPPSALPEWKVMLQTVGGHIDRWYRRHHCVGGTRWKANVSDQYQGMAIGYAHA